MEASKMYESGLYVAIVNPDEKSAGRAVLFWMPTQEYIPNNVRGIIFREEPMSVLHYYMHAVDAFNYVVAIYPISVFNKVMIVPASSMPIQCARDGHIALRKGDSAYCMREPERRLGWWCDYAPNNDRVCRYSVSEDHCDFCGLPLERK